MEIKWALWSKSSLFFVRKQGKDMLLWKLTICLDYGYKHSSSSIIMNRTNKMDQENGPIDTGMRILPAEF